MQSESLIHEAYLRVIELKDFQWRDSNHFYSVWSGIMQRVVIDRARAKKTFKRGGLTEKVPLYDTIPAASNLDELDLYDALEKLKHIDKALYRIVELRFFSGLTIDEVAKTLAISTATVKPRKISWITEVHASSWRA